MKLAPRMSTTLRELLYTRSVWTICARFALILTATLILVIYVDPALHRLHDAGLVWRNLLPVLLVACLIYALCARVLFSVWLTAVLTHALYAISAIKETNMNMPLMPGDLLLGHQILHNIEFFAHYAIHGLWTILAALLVLAFSWFLWKLEREWSRPSWITRAIWVILPVIVLYTLFQGNGFWSKVYSSRSLDHFQLWNPTESVNRAGLMAGLVYMSQQSDIRIPKANTHVVRTFAKKHVASLKSRISRGVPAHLPDIVIVQSEAFFDPGVMKQIDFGQFDPNFQSLSKTGISGAMTAPTYGGGTIRTEFETLTGYPIRAFPSVIYPYYGLVGSWMPSVPTRLAALGYSTTLFHPFLSSFWNRQQVMPELGFRKMYFEPAFKDAKRAGKYVADRSLFNFVLKHLKKNSSQPQYVMAITMENHGPWERDPGKLAALLKGHKLPSGLKPEGTREMKYYLSHLINGDRALEDFAKKLMARQHWTVLLFYGDHLPALSHAYREIGFDNGLLHGRQSTRYMLLSNRPLKPRMLNLNAFELPGLLFDTIGLPMDGYLAFDGAVRQAWVQNHFQRGPIYGQILYNAARMEVGCKHKLTLAGTCPGATRKKTAEATTARTTAAKPSASPARASSTPPSANTPCESGSCNNGELRIEPANKVACNTPTGQNTVTVDWNAPDAKSGNVRIWVLAPGAHGAPTLWTEKTSSGTARTGPWAAPGMQIILTDRVSGKKLSMLTVPARKCGQS